MDDAALLARFDDSRRPLGPCRRTLVIGSRAIGLEGLDDDLASALDGRWGGFLREATAAEDRYSVSFVRGGAGWWLPRSPEVEGYRLEARAAAADDRWFAVSYHFAMASSRAGAACRVAMSDDPAEPRERIVDNAVRYLCARLAVDDGGFAIHGAGLLRNGRAWLFAGPSGSGKSTIARLGAPATNLGDDFALVVPTAGGWSAPAVPFDNSERMVRRPPSGLFPVAGIWRLHHGRRNRLETPTGMHAVAALMGCCAFPWATPDLAGRLLEHVGRFVGRARFAHLHFVPDRSVWTLLESEVGQGAD